MRAAEGHERQEKLVRVWQHDGTCPDPPAPWFPTPGPPSGPNGECPKFGAGPCGQRPSGPDLPGKQNPKQPTDPKKDPPAGTPPCDPKKDPTCKPPCTGSGCKQPPPKQPREPVCLSIFVREALGAMSPVPVDFVPGLTDFTQGEAKDAVLTFQWSTLISYAGSRE